MKFDTHHFGAVAVDESSTIDFPAGLPGFEDCRRFVVLQHPTVQALTFVQSLEQPGLCFLMLPVQLVRQDYELSIANEDLELLGLSSGNRPQLGKDLLALAILSVAEGEPATANLLSPVVIHIASRRAVQAIRPDRIYGCRELLAMEEAVCS